MAVSATRLSKMSFQKKALAAVFSNTLAIYDNRLAILSKSLAAG